MISCNKSGKLWGGEGCDLWGVGLRRWQLLLSSQKSLAKQGGYSHVPVAGERASLQIQGKIVIPKSTFSYS